MDITFKIMIAIAASVAIIWQSILPVQAIGSDNEMGIESQFKMQKCIDVGLSEEYCKAMTIITDQVHKEVQETAKETEGIEAKARQICLETNSSDEYCQRFK